tara:strand:+ start:454 stop:714 length:261 start_codon:yes stop_codon:yes gene_type:complete
MPDDDLDYLQRRVETELEMAQRSETPEVTAAHYKLAEAYLERVEALRASAAAEAGEQGGEAFAEAGAAAAGLLEGRKVESGERVER